MKNVTGFGDLRCFFRFFPRWERWSFACSAFAFSNSTCYELDDKDLNLEDKLLGLHLSQFKQHRRAEGKTTLCMKHYPPCSHPDIIEGLYAHSDASVVLIVHQGLERGLQILKVDKWVGVQPNPASFIVNISKAIMLGPPVSLFHLLAEHC